ncbi:Ribosome biogenesis protein brx1 [Chytridiales sp. JEL 0842]|nr:Ribosome biogenesis protein brx1 [Chytridiales sp. JEL 0842]
MNLNSEEEAELKALLEKEGIPEYDEDGEVIQDGHGDDDDEDDEVEGNGEYYDEDDDEESEDEDDIAAPTGRKALLAKGDKSQRKSLNSKRDLEEAEDADDQEGEEEQEQVQQNGAKTDKKIVRNKQRVLVLSSRGITQRYRHLMNDLYALLPHSKKDNKLDTKSNLHILNELAADNQCNNAIFFEVRKHKDLYMWMSKTPNGPSAKFYVQNVHTMDELRMTGNCLKGSRPLLSFDKNFDLEPQYQLLKEMFTHIFATPKSSRKIKPFIDHILSFSILNNRIYFRHYQILQKKNPSTNQNETSLVEIGPRFSLSIIRIFNGSFQGATLFENPEYVSPNTERRNVRLAHQAKYVKRVNAAEAREQKPKLKVDDPFKDVFK